MSSYRSDVERDQIVAALRQMADRVADDTFGCLTLQALAHVWGREFFELVMADQYYATKTIHEALTIMRDLIVELRESRKQ